jgi:hypothetical protein
MPKVVYTKAKGLVQETGAGFALNEIEIMNGTNLTLTAGTTVAILKSAHDVTLPTADNNTGDMILVIADHASAEIAAAGTQIGGKVTFDSVGDGAIAVYDGTEWQVLRSIT